MSHNDFTRLSGQWPLPFVPVARDMQRLDDLASRSIDGDNGGTWTPTSPIIIGNQGIQTTTAGTSLEGGIVTANGGRLQLGDNDFPTFYPSRTRSIVLPLHQCRIDPAHIPNLGVSLDPLGLTFTADLTPGDLTPQVIIPGRYFHAMSTLSSATLTFRVAGSRNTVPAQLPGFGIYSMNSTHGVVSLLGSFNTLSAPGSGAAYYAGGAPQTIVGAYAVNFVDPTVNTWVVKLQDESGGNAQGENIYHSLTLGFTNIASAGFE